VTVPANALGIMEPAFGFGAGIAADPVGGGGLAGLVTGGLTGGWPVTGGLAGSGVVEVSEDFWQALYLLLSTSSTLVDMLPGGVWKEAAGHDAPLPYLLIVDPADDVHVPMTSSGDYSTIGTVQLSVYAEGMSEVAAATTARSILWRVASLVNDAPLTFDRGTLVYLRQSMPDRGLDDPDPGPNGGPVHQRFTIFDYRIAWNIHNL
jgi:hypothetical protein